MYVYNLCNLENRVDSQTCDLTIMNTLHLRCFACLLETHAPGRVLYQTFGSIYSGRSTHSEEMVIFSVFRPFPKINNYIITYSSLNSNKDTAVFSFIYFGMY